MLTIRKETSADINAIRPVNESAFNGKVEADILDKLRARGAITLSLVAVLEDKIIGHILFSPVTIESGKQKFPALGLGPVAVLPDYQGKGIGAKLIRTGLAECRKAGHKAVVVLGHPPYYPKFGFVRASTFGIKCEYDAPDEAFMVLELNKGALTGVSGTAKYQSEFNEA